MKAVEDIDLKTLIENETLQTFNRSKKIKSPFNPNDDTPSFSIYFDTNNNKWKFKDFSTGQQGDCIDFIMEYKNMDYVQAREYLGLEVDKTKDETDMELITEYVNKQIKDFYKGYKLTGIFKYVDENNNPIYYKVKLNDSKGKKITPYYHIENNKVIAKRGTEKELPYNLHNVLRGIEEGKIIIITEGEKDCNKLNSLFRNGYVACSCKNVKDFEVLKTGKPLKVYVLGDTGEAGEKYISYIVENFMPISAKIKVIKLPKIAQLGDNKDVTDWLEAGHTKEELKVAFKRALDLKNSKELQQDDFGIYKTVYDKKEEKYFKAHITNFNVLSAKRLVYADTGEEGIELKLKSHIGKEYIKKDVATVFDTIKDFKNFLGSIDLSFKSTDTVDLTTLKDWINEHFALDVETLYKGDNMVKIDDKLGLVTGYGTLIDGKLDKSILSEKKLCFAAEKESITKEELQEVVKHLFNFINLEKSTSIIGSIISYLMTYQAEKSKVFIHHLQLVGESGSGKTTILDNVIAPILNYPLDERKSVGLITPFALQMDLSNGNYPRLYDEFKPSMMDKYKLPKISDILRNLYTRATVSRSSRSFQNTNFKLASPIILAGEEGYPNNEKALIERTCIVYLSRFERTKENSKCMKWLIENEKLLNKLGRSLIDESLELSVDEYKKIREETNTKFEFKERIQNTAINIATGIELLNRVLIKYNLEPISSYEQYISSNIKAEILTDTGQTLSVVEQMLTIFDEIIENGYSNGMVVIKSDGVYIRTQEMINKIFEEVKKGSYDLIPIRKNDFKKQAEKAGYLYKDSSTPLRIRYGESSSKVYRFDKYNKEAFEKLNLKFLVESEPQEDYKNDNNKVKKLDEYR